MAICRFCLREFQSEQSVKSHLKKCDLYEANKRNKKAAALGRLPQGDVTSPPAPAAAPDLTAPLQELIKAFSELSSKQNMPPTPQQQHRVILQAAKVEVIDHYRTSLGTITASLRGAAKLAIEQQLTPLPLVDLPLRKFARLPPPFAMISMARPFRNKRGRRCASV